MFVKRNIYLLQNLQALPHGDDVCISQAVAFRPLGLKVGVLGRNAVEQTPTGGNFESNVPSGVILDAVYL